jgi:hypothetical protein
VKSAYTCLATMSDITTFLHTWGDRLLPPHEKPLLPTKGHLKYTDLCLKGGMRIDYYSIGGCWGVVYSSGAFRKIMEVVEKFDTFPIAVAYVSSIMKDKKKPTHTHRMVKMLAEKLMVSEGEIRRGLQKDDECLNSAVAVYNMFRLHLEGGSLFDSFCPIRRMKYGRRWTPKYFIPT